MRRRNPCESRSQGRWWRNTRTLLKPRPSAHPSSRSIVGRSKVPACHISSWLIAVLGAKLQPTSQGCAWAQVAALEAGQGLGSGVCPAAIAGTGIRPAASPAMSHAQDQSSHGRSIASGGRERAALKQVAVYVGGPSGINRLAGNEPAGLSHPARSTPAIRHAGKVAPHGPARFAFPRSDVIIQPVCPPRRQGLPTDRHPRPDRIAGKRLGHGSSHLSTPSWTPADRRPARCVRSPRTDVRAHRLPRHGPTLIGSPPRPPGRSGGAPFLSKTLPGVGEASGSAGAAPPFFCLFRNPSARSRLLQGPRVAML